MEEKKQISNDNFLKVEQIILSSKDSSRCKGVDKSYSRYELESSEILIEGFCEHKWIWFRCRLEEDEECKLYISDEVPLYRYDKKKNGYIYRWKTDKYANVFPITIEITKEGEVSPRKYNLKIDVLTKFDDGDSNKDNFNNMMNEIRDACINPYRLSSPSRISKDEKISTYPIPLDQLFYICENDIIKKLEHIMYYISLNPHGECIEEVRRDVLDIVDNNVISEMLSKKGDLIDIRCEYISPEIQSIFIENGIECISGDILMPRPIITYNVFENQLLKTFLTIVIVRMRDAEYILEYEKKEYEKQKKRIQKVYDSEKLAMKNRQIENVELQIARCRKYIIRLQNMKMYPFLDGVQETRDITRCSSILQKDINYNRFYNIIRKFLKTPKFYFSNSLGLTMLDTPMAYEYWTALEIRKGLFEKLQGDWKKTYDNMIREFKHGCIIRFPNGKLLEFTKGKVKIYLFYHESYRRFTGGYYIPDISLEGTINGKLFETIIFDAKYTTNLDSGEENTRSPITIMHAVRDAIIGHVEKDESIIESGIQIVGSAFALLLGESKRKSLPNDPNNEAGGIRFVPKKDHINREEIDDIIQNFIYRLLQKANDDA